MLWMALFCKGTRKSNDFGFGCVWRVTKLYCCNNSKNFNDLIGQIFFVSPVYSVSGWVDSACSQYARSQTDGGSISTHGSMISMAKGRRLLLIIHWLSSIYLEDAHIFLAYCSLARASCMTLEILQRVKKCNSTVCPEENWNISTMVNICHMLSYSLVF